MLTVIFLIFCLFLLVTGIFNFRKSLQVYVFTFPFVQPYMYVTSGSVSITLQGLLSICILLILVQNFFFSKKFRLELSTCVHNKTIQIFCAIMLVTVFGSLSALPTNLVNYLSFLLRQVSLIYIGWLTFSNINEGRNLIKNLLAGFTLLALYGVIEFSMKSNPIVDYFSAISKQTSSSIFFYKIESRGYRIQSIFYHAYAWGGALILISSFFLYLVLHAQKFRMFCVYMLMYVIIVFNSFFTRGRSCILPILFIAVAIMFRKASSRKKKNTFALILVASCLLSIILFPDIIDSIAPYFSFSEESGGLHGSSLSMRSNQYLTAFNLINNNIFLGNGFDFLYNYLSKFGKTEDLKGAESAWIIILINHGLIGIIAYSAFFIGLIKNFSKFKITHIRISQQTNFIILTILGYLLFISMTGFMHTFELFLILIGVVSKYLYVEQKELQSTVLK